MATRKLAMKPLADFEKVDPQVCSLCGHGCIRGDFSSVANFGVTREPHFVTSYGWMQVKYDRATAVDAYMCLNCGHIEFFGRSPLAVLDPLERQQQLRAIEPALDKRMVREEKRRKEQEPKGSPVESDDHVGI